MRRSRLTPEEMIMLDKMAIERFTINMMLEAMPNRTYQTIYGYFYRKGIDLELEFMRRSYKDVFLSKPKSNKMKPGPKPKVRAEQPRMDFVDI